MAPCAHVHWLRLRQDQRTFSLHYTHRLDHITKSLPHPSTQYPSLLFFVGHKSKTLALRKIYPENRLSRHRYNSIANICVDTRTIDDDYPVIVADGTLGDTADVNPSISQDGCHETTSHSLCWSESKSGPPQRQDLIDIIHARLFSLFIDVLCIFAEDYGGLTGVVTKLATWTSIGSASSLPITVRPRIVVVTRIQGDLFVSEVLRFRSQVLSTPNFSKCFSSLNVVNMPGTLRLISVAQFEAVKELLIQETLAARLSRTEAHVLFSSTHSSAFFGKALKRFSEKPKTSFNFIRASREENAIDNTFSNHISTFMSLCLKHNLPDNLPLIFVSSAILLDSFPPDMHLFMPSHVFHDLYRPFLLDGIKEFARVRQLSSDLICSDIEAQVGDMALRMDSGHQSAVMVRIESLLLHSKYWMLLEKTRKVCLYCLRRETEHVLDCGHAICDICVSIFGEPSKGLEYHFDIDTCLLCKENFRFQARILPPTCQVRFLSIDGGGSKGIVSLEFLDAFQDALDLPYPVRENFDYSIGTSSGGVEVLAIFGKKWDTKKCLMFFHKFAKRVFPPDFGVRGSMVTKIWRFFASYFADGQYDAVFMEETLREAFGSSPLFDSPGIGPSGMKFAVTATTISDATLCLFSNYNGAGNHRKELRCKHLRASNADNEVLLWEAARCTTAAPWYFKPKYLKSFGTFQDGGLKYNNPVRPGLREVQRIWNTGDCDIVLSIGTGFKEQLHSPKAPNVRNLFQDGAVARLYRASMSSLSLDSGNSWKDHWYGLKDEIKAQHFRLDLPLIGIDPRMDDVDQMSDLQSQVRHHLGDLDGLARAFKAVSFFFELDAPVAREGTTYICHGSILSRSPNSRALIQNLSVAHPYSQFVTNAETSLGFLSVSDVCHLCGRFQKAVSFSVRHPSEMVNLYFVFNRLFRRNISGFPHSMEWFQERQLFNAHFGRADHAIRARNPLDSDCSCVQRRHNLSSASRSVPRKRLLPSEELRRSKRHRQSL